MNRRTAAIAAPPRVVYYPDPAQHNDIQPYHPARVAARRREYAVLYARWAERQAVLAERDRKARRFWLGFGATVGTAVVAAGTAVVWALWQAITGLTLGVLAAPLALLALGGLAVCGHRCITIVQHWH